MKPYTQNLISELTPFGVHTFAKKEGVVLKPFGSAKFLKKKLDSVEYGVDKL